MLVCLPEGIGTGAGWAAGGTGGGGGVGSSRTSTGSGAGGRGGGGGATGCAGAAAGAGGGTNGWVGPLAARKLGRADRPLWSAETRLLMRARSITSNRIVLPSQRIGSHFCPSSGSVGPVSENR